jgi:hypothetical protein
VRTEIQALCSALGGDPTTPIRPGAWDLAFAGGLVVELDEELHFNRFRTRTLQPAWTAALPWREDYLAHSNVHEQECSAAGRWGRRWTSGASETMFGPPPAPGVPEGRGAPRWKQRALYDAVKDITASTSSAIRLARLSVWDTVGGVRLGDALTLAAHIDPDHLHGLLEQRTTKPNE